jgi:uncharacterized protein YerC
MSYPLAKNSPTTSKSLPFSELLSSAELETLNVRIAANADQWLADNAPKINTKLPRKPKSTCGPKPKMIENPFYGFVGYTTFWGRYPAFALDIIEGIARLDWHDRPTGEGGKPMPLSVRKLVMILESLPVVTNEAVEDLLQLGERHARRYVKAIELIVPRMMKSRPQSLINEMDGIEPELKDCDWDDRENLRRPTAEELEKLHHDLRTLTEFKTAKEYEAEYPMHPASSCVKAFPARQQHLKKAEVLRMLIQDMAVKAIERATGVSPKTIRKWRDEMHIVQGELNAA